MSGRLCALCLWAVQFQAAHIVYRVGEREYAVPDRGAYFLAAYRRVAAGLHPELEPGGQWKINTIPVGVEAVTEVRGTVACEAHVADLINDPQWRR